MGSPCEPSSEPCPTLLAGVFYRGYTYTDVDIYVSGVYMYRERCVWIYIYICANIDYEEKGLFWRIL